MPQQPIKKVKVETSDNAPLVVDIGALAENIYIDETTLDKVLISFAFCNTEANIAAKVAKCANYTNTAKKHLHIIIKNTNSYEGALTLEINETGAKPIYINGIISSSTNNTLPAGDYLVYYDGTNYYFRTDDQLTANITGDAKTINGINIAKVGNAYGYYKTDGTFVPFKSQADIDAAVAAAMVGNATAADVLSGKTFTNSTTSGVTGSIGTASVTGGTNTSDGYTASIAAKKYTGTNGSSVTVAKGSVSGAGQSDGSFKYSIAGGRYTGASGSSGTISKLTPSYSSGSSQSSLLAGGTATLPANTYNKNSYTITAASLASQTSANAGADDILKNATAWVNGSKITGRMPDNGTWGRAQETGTNYVRFPYGFYDIYYESGATVNPQIYLTADQAKNVLSHTATATPTGSDRKNTAYNLGEKHNYRYVNTRVCYDYGKYRAANTIQAFLAVDAWEGHEAYGRIDFTVEKGTTINFFNFNTEARHKIRITKVNGPVIYDSGYFQDNTTKQYTTDQSTTYIIELWSENGHYQCCNISMSCPD